MNELVRFNQHDMQDFDAISIVPEHITSFQDFFSGLE